MENLSQASKAFLHILMTTVHKAHLRPAYRLSPTTHLTWERFSVAGKGFAA